MTDKNCIFCKIISGKISSKKIIETETMISFYDLNPQAPFHVLVLPKVHCASLNDLDKQSRKNILPDLFSLADEISIKLGFRETGYRCVINNQNMAGQSVFHLHLHILGGAKLSARFGS